MQTVALERHCGLLGGDSHTMIENVPDRPPATSDYWHFNYGALFSQQYAD